jgi:hypothetical protein
MFEGFSPLAYQIERQTEKALQLRVATMRGERNVWLPKSQCQIAGRVVWVKDWLYEKSSRENNGIIRTDRNIALSLSV